MIGSASILARRTGAFPRWLAASGVAFSPLLALSGLAFPLRSDLLYTTLALTLLVLLSWVATVTIVARHAPASRSALAVVTAR